MTESDFLALLRPLASHPAARGFADDAAVLGDLVLTHDMLVEGVHFRPTDPPGDVAWKLLAVNLSDLAAKGAVPLGVLLGYPIGDDGWDAAFVDGLEQALAHFAVPLLGGDTVSASARVLALTAIGRSPVAPARSGARAGDALYVTGTIGLAGLGLRGEGGAEALAAYRRPVPRLAEGQALAPIVHAMMDVSDGLLIDAGRMAQASGLALAIDLDAVPMAGERDQTGLAERVEAPFSVSSRAKEAGLRHAQASHGSNALMAAITAGDDYELLFAAPADAVLPVPASRIGRFAAGSGLTLHDAHGQVPLPDRLGWQHGAHGQ